MVKCLWHKHEDPRNPHKTLPSCGSALTIPALARQSQEDLWGCWPGSLAESASSSPERDPVSNNRAQSLRSNTVVDLWFYTGETHNNTIKYVKIIAR